MAELEFLVGAALDEQSIALLEKNFSKVIGNIDGTLELSVDDRKFLQDIKDSFSAAVKEIQNFNKKASINIDTSNVSEVEKQLNGLLELQKKYNDISNTYKNKKYKTGSAGDISIEVDRLEKRLNELLKNKNRNGLYSSTTKFEIATITQEMTKLESLYKKFGSTIPSKLPNFSNIKGLGDLKSSEQMVEALNNKIALLQKNTASSISTDGVEKMSKALEDLQPLLEKISKAFSSVDGGDTTFDKLIKDVEALKESLSEVLKIKPVVDESSVEDARKQISDKAVSVQVTPDVDVDSFIGDIQDSIKEKTVKVKVEADGDVVPEKSVKPLSIPAEEPQKSSKYKVSSPALNGSNIGNFRRDGDSLSFVHKQSIAQEELAESVKGTTGSFGEQAKKIREVLLEIQELQKLGKDYSLLNINPQYYNGYLQLSGHLSGATLRKGSTTKTDISKAITEYNKKLNASEEYRKKYPSLFSEKAIGGALDRIAALVAAHKDLENAQSVFGKSNEVLWNKVTERIELAKKAQQDEAKLEAKQYLLADFIRNGRDIKYTYGNEDEILKILNTDGVDAAVNHIIKKFDIVEEKVAELKNSTSAQVNETKLSSPTQKFDNEVQQDIVYLENYKNTIEEINKLKIEPQTDETKRKIEELQKLAEYFFGNIKIVQSEWGSDGGNFVHGNSHWYGKYPSDTLGEIYSIGKELNGNRFNINALTTEFSGISDEISLIESKSEELKNKFAKDLSESRKYVNNLKSDFLALIDMQEELNSGYITDADRQTYQKDTDDILRKYPELNQIKDRFSSYREAGEFTKADGWLDFVATLPQACKYLESIGYDFERLSKHENGLSSGTTAPVIEDIKEAEQEFNKLNNDVEIFVNGIKKLSKTDYLERIPKQYRELFSGMHFENADEFKNAAARARQLESAKGTVIQQDHAKDDLDYYIEKSNKLKVAYEKAENAKRKALDSNANKSDISTDTTSTIPQQIEETEKLVAAKEELRIEEEKLHEEQKSQPAQNNSVTEEFEKEEQTVKEVTEKEENALSSLAEHIRTEVIPAIEAKTQAFREEGQTVDGVVQEERTNLEMLAGYVHLVYEEIEKLMNKMVELQKSDVNIDIKVSDVDFTSFDLTEFKTQLNNLPLDETSDQLLMLYDYFDLFVKEVNNLKFNGELKDFLSQIENITKQGKALEDFANILSNSMKNIQNAANAAGVDVALPDSVEALEKLTVLSQRSVDFDEIFENSEKAKQVREELGGVVDVIEQIRERTDKDGKVLDPYISYQLKGANGSAYIGKNGDLLRQNTVRGTDYSDAKKTQREAEQARKQEINDQIRINQLEHEQLELEEKETQEKRKQFEKFIQEGTNYNQRNAEDEAKARFVERRNSAYKELNSTITDYIDAKKRIANDQMFEGDIELAEKLEKDIDEISASISEKGLFTASKDEDALRRLIDLEKELSNIENERKRKNAEKNADKYNKDTDARNEAQRKDSVSKASELQRVVYEDILNTKLKISELELNDDKNSKEKVENLNKELSLLQSVYDDQKKIIHAKGTEAEIEKQNTAIKKLSSSYTKNEEKIIDNAVKADEKKRQALQEAAEAAAKASQAQKEAIESENQKLLDQFDTLEKLKQEWIDTEARATNAKGTAKENTLSIAAEDAKKKYEDLKKSIEDAFNEMFKNQNRIPGFNDFYDKYLTRSSKVGSINTISDKLVAELKDKATDSITKSTQDSIKQDSKEIERWIKEFSKVENAKRYVQDLKDEARNLKDEFSKFNLNDYFNPDKVDDTKKAFAELIDKAEKFKSAMNDESNLVGNADTISKLRTKVAKTIAENTAMSPELMKEFKSFQATLRAIADAGGANKKVTLEQASAFNELVARMNEAGKVGLSVTDQIKKRILSINESFIGMFFGLYDFVNYLRNMSDTVVGLDTALVDLSKTAKMSTSQLNEFYFSSNDVAKQTGVTTSEIIQQASEWSRLGYNTAEAATKMAGLSSQFAAISPDMDVSQATDGLVSVMKAFDIAEDQVEEGIMSKINAVGNNFATTNGEIVEGLKRDAASMQAANNSLEQTIALFSSGIEITRDAESMGAALKTISMRVRGYDEETEELTEEYENLSGTIADLTKTASKPGGISLFTDSSKQTYKSTYEILKEISEIWDEISDKNQANKICLYV